MKTLVTGATGFVGSAVTRKLINEGFEVKVTVRANSDLRNLQGLDVEKVIADLSDRESLVEAVKNCNALFHVAADYRLWARNPDTLYETNVRGTKNIFQIARQSDIERMVYTSSVATLGLHTDGTPADEETVSTIDDMHGHYKRSKFMAEEWVRDFVAKKEADIVIVNPAAPIGPRDIKPTPTGKLVVDAARGRMPAFVDTGLDVVHVDDVADGHLRAFRQGQPGHRYILGSTNMRLRDILVEVARLVGRKPPWLRLPPALILPVAYVAEAIGRIAGIEPIVTVAGVQLSRNRMFFSSQRAKDELGYSPRPGREAINDAVNWFGQHGYLG